jgi:hypothetical protein
MSGGGILIVETSDAKALYSWLSYWNDLLEFETTPCLDDAEPVRCWHPKSAEAALRPR